MVFVNFLLFLSLSFVSAKLIANEQSLIVYQKLSSCLAPSNVLSMLKTEGSIWSDVSFYNYL